MDRVGNSAERSLWIALETQQNAHYGSRWKLSRTLTMDRVGNSAERSLWIALETQQNAHYGSRSRTKVSRKDCCNSDRFILSLWVKVMV
ncbi:hypothetical protein MAL01_14665 [Leptospira noguchii]|nr:hypothetical protein [Leptospira noguchii]UOG44608.1 hypothetical protein MAL01_14665 [Leptospira noguchii]